MLFKENKFYENLVATEKEKREMIDECFKILDDDSLPSDDDISLRRKENMKKKEYGDIFKRVVVASLSLAATGAIIVGVTQYKQNNDNKEVINNTVAKNTTVESTTELEEVETKEVDNGYVESAVDEKLGKQVDFGTYDNPKDIKTWSVGYLQNLAKEAYNSDGSVRKGYVKRTYTDEAGNSIDIVGKNFIDISAEDNKNDDINGRKVYFEVGDKLYRVLVDEILSQTEGGKVNSKKHTYTSPDGKDYYIQHNYNTWWMGDYDKDEYRYQFSEEGHALIGIYAEEYNELKYDDNTKEIKFYSEPDSFHKVYKNCLKADKDYNMRFYDTIHIYKNDKIKKSYVILDSQLTRSYDVESDSWTFLFKTEDEEFYEIKNLKMPYKEEECDYYNQPLTPVEDNNTEYNSISENEYNKIIDETKPE